MKINCQSCEAKYTIADEKVRGKTVKIRCKKCGAAIVVKGNETPPQHGVEDEEDDATRVFPQAGGSPSLAPSPIEWTLNMPDGEQRAVSPEEIAQLVATGAITADTYAWRDGMGDWQPLSQIAELAPMLVPQAPRPSASPAPDPRLAGVFGGESGGQARVAARRQERARDQDLFGAARKAGSDEEVAARAEAAPVMLPAPKHTFTAERGENSVLFSVEAIRATAKPATRPAQASNDKVDFNALASNIPPPMDTSGGGFDDVLNNPPSFPSFGGPMLAAPMLPTEIEPEPPPPPDPFVAAAAEPMPAKSNKGLVIGLVAAIVLVGMISLAFGGYVLFSKSPADTAPSATAATTTSAPAETAKPEDTAPPTASAEEPKAADADAGAAPEGTGDSTKAEPTKAEPTKADPTKAEPTKADAKKDPAKKDDTKKDPPKDTPPAAETTAPPAAGGAPFSRSAAVSALNGAAGAASGCKKPDGPTGRGRVSVTFAPSGRVTTAVVNGSPFAGTSVGGCVAAAFRRASVPPFTGSPVTVHKSFSIQ